MPDHAAGSQTRGLREDRLNVEFTQHAGDEMDHPTLGGYSPDWSADER